MPGTRTTFGRVDALLEILQFLGTAEGLAGVDISDTQLQPFTFKESIFPGAISGQIGQPVSGAGRTRDQDDFVIPLHVCAENETAQATGLDARRRCEDIIGAVRDTVATIAALPGVPGVIDVVVTSVDGPDPEPVVDPAGWVAYGTVNVRVRIRMH